MFSIAQRRQRVSLLVTSNLGQPAYR